MNNCLNTALSEIVGKPVGNTSLTFDTVSDTERYGSEDSYRHGMTIARVTFTTIGNLSDYRYGSLVIYSYGINDRFQMEYSAHLIHGEETTKIVGALFGLFCNRKE